MLSAWRGLESGFACGRHAWCTYPVPFPGTATSAWHTSSHHCRCRGLTLFRKELVVRCSEITQALFEPYESPYISRSSRRSQPPALQQAAAVSSHPNAPPSSSSSGSCKPKPSLRWPVRKQLPFVSWPVHLSWVRVMIIGVSCFARENARPHARTAVYRLVYNDTACQAGFPCTGTFNRLRWPSGVREA